MALLKELDELAFSGPLLSLHEAADTASLHSSAVSSPDVFHKPVIDVDVFLLRPARKPAPNGERRKPLHVV